MSDFITAAPKRIAPDPNKRVNYTLGLVLGVDEFEQEEAYFLERARQHDRELHGYGTVCGLDLTIDGSQVIVSAGMAIDPRGRVILVAKDQCGDLNDWLKSADNQAIVGSNNKPYELYVTLCYNECQTDRVPIPGAPCRTEDDTMDYSRVTETFSLQFSPTPPPAEEEAAVREFGNLLQRVQVSSGGAGPFLVGDDLVPYVRGLLLLDSPMPSPLPSPISSPLGAPLLVKPADAEEVLRAAFRVWTTEVRPQLLPDGANCASGPGGDACVLLGRVDFTITNAWTVDPAVKVLPDERERPLLLHTRLLQEWMLRALANIGETGNTVQAPAGLPVYNIVAAGIVSGEGGQLPLYDGTLAASSPKDGQLELKFTSYVQPDKTFMYIVKAMPVCNDTIRTALTLTSPVVSLDSFSPTGIILSVFDKGIAIPQATLDKLEVMVEISLYRSA